MTGDASGTSTAGGSPRAEGGRAPRWHVPLLVVLGLFVFFFGLGSYSVVNGDEGIYHVIAATMVERGDFTHLDYHGQHRVYDTFMNAPTQYWARAALIAAFGDNLWTMRLLSACFGLATVLAVHRLASELDPAPGRVAALLAALVQLTSFQFVYLHGARTGELDAVVSFLFVAIAIAFLRGVRAAASTAGATAGGSFVPHHLLLALLLSVKVPAVIVPIAAELLFFATTKAARTHFSRWALCGLAVLPLGLVWHVAQALALGDEFREVLAKMSGEAEGTVGGGAYSGGPLENLVWYGERALHGLFPWSLAVLPALVGLWLAPKTERERAGWRFVLLLALAVWLFFAAVSKRFPWYPLPSYPLFAVAIGAWLARLARESLSSAARSLNLLLAAAVLALLPWIAVPITGVRPLVDRAAVFPMDVAWRTFEPLGTPGVVALTFALVLGLFLAVRRLAPGRSGRFPAGLLACALLSVGALRVLLPLGSLAHESHLARLHAKLELERAAGRAIPYPIVLPESEGWLRVQYYFGRRFRVEQVGRAILLQGEKAAEQRRRE